MGDWGSSNLSFENVVGNELLMPYGSDFGSDFGSDSGSDFGSDNANQQEIINEDTEKKCIVVDCKAQISTKFQKYKMCEQCAIFANEDNQVYLEVLSPQKQNMNQWWPVM